MVQGEKVLLIEPSTGISGDMFISGLLDLGLDGSWLRDTIKSALPEDVEIVTWKDTRGGISGTRFQVKSSEGESHRSLSEIKEIIEAAALPNFVRKRSIEMFELLAEVEAGIHGVGVEEVRFHEVGALDSIADIVGASAGIWKIDPDRVYSTAVNLGRGTVSTAHGQLPVPAPATAEILSRCEAPTYSGDLDVELTTPTGALILHAFVDEFVRPGMKLENLGYGLGSREVEGRGNFLRVTLGTAEEDGNTQSGAHELILETNIDDMNPEFFPTVEEKLMEAGALDVFKTTVQMKKNRPGVKLTVICDREKEEELAEIIFRETTTLGVRVREVRRRKLDREISQVSTEYGNVKVKVGYLDGSPVNYSPEFESCRKLSEKTGKPLKEIFIAALSSARKELDLS
jgi:hypothetical protein